MCLGIPGQITAIVDEARKLAIVEVGGVKRQINIACILDSNQTIDTCIGAWVLVHVGFAMNRIDEQEAIETLKLLDELTVMQYE